jgi:TolB-like protein
MADPPISVTGLWQRLKERKVIVWTLAYLGFAFTVLGGAELLHETLEWPPHTIAKLLALLLLLGVPVVTLLAWYHGDRAQARASGMEIAILAVLLFVLGSILWHASRTDGENVAAVVPVSVPKVAAAATPAAVSDKSIAVLPFVNASSDPEQEYFSDGLSTELIELLTKVPDLRVSARTSSFFFKGKSEDIATIAQKLRVAHVLEGTVQKSGHTVRVTAQLIQADSGYNAWSDTYDGDLEDIFQVQDKIAGSVVKSLKATLLSSGAGGDRTTNVDAYSLLLQGRFLIERQTEVDWRQAIQILQRAVALDPSYAPAWVELSRVYLLLSGYVDPKPDQDAERARDAAKKALALDPESATAHIALANVKATYDFDWKGAAEQVAAAHRADPNLNIGAFGAVAFVAGCDAGPCYEKLIKESSEDIDRDPMNAGAYRDRARIRYAGGQLDGAESDIRRAMELSPSIGGGRYLLTRILIARHELANALSVAAADSGVYRRAGLALAYQALGRQTEADAALKDLLARDAHGGAYQIAEVYAARGDTAAALTWLESAYRQHDSGLIYIKVNPLFKPLAHEGRYMVLLDKLGLTN